MIDKYYEYAKENYDEVLFYRNLFFDDGQSIFPQAKFYLVKHNNKFCAFFICFSCGSECECITSGYISLKEEEENIGNSFKEFWYKDEMGLHNYLQENNFVQSFSGAGLCDHYAKKIRSSLNKVLEEVGEYLLVSYLAKI